MVLNLPMMAKTIEKKRFDVVSTLELDNKSLV